MDKTFVIDLNDRERVRYRRILEHLAEDSFAAVRALDDQNDDALLIRVFSIALLGKVIQELVNIMVETVKRGAVDIPDDPSALFAPKDVVDPKQDPDYRGEQLRGRDDV